MEATSLKDILDRVFNEISEVRESSTPRLTLREVGTIKTVSTGIANVFSLPGVGFEELIKFPGDVYGIAFNVDEEEIGVVLLGEYYHLNAGTRLNVLVGLWM